MYQNQNLALSGREHKTFTQWFKNIVYNITYKCYLEREPWTSLLKINFDVMKMFILK